MKKAILVVVMMVSSFAKAGFEFEVDPLAYLLEGYSGHLIYDTEKGVSVDLGAFGLKIPDSMEPKDGFDTSFTGYGVKLAYYGKSIDGAFWGLSYGTTDYEVEQTSSHAKQKLNVQSAGVQFGYRFGKKNLFVKPWIGFDKILNAENLNFNGTEYKVPEFNIFPTVHLGYSF